MLKNQCSELLREQAQIKVMSVLIQSLVRENIDQWGVQSQSSEQELNLGHLCVTIKNVGALGQFELAEFPTWKGREVSDPGQIVEFLELQGQRERLATELRQCVDNLCLARLATEERRSKGEGHPESVAGFEQWVCEGHPLHPCAKMRSPLTAEQQKTYSPEFGSQFDLRLVAVKNSHAKQTGIGSNQSLAQDHPDLWKQIQERTDCDKNTIIPVHPYQAEHVLPQTYQTFLDDGSITILDGLSIPVRPLMSFRSMEPVGQKKFQIKTAVGVRMTNAVRTVSPQAAENGPELSRFLKDLNQRDSLEPLHILHEVGGAYFSAGDWDLARNMSVLFRESPETFVTENQVGMPAASLIEKGPDGRIMAISLVEQVGCLETFVKSYCQTLLPPLMKLLSCYGVALEAHLQNCVVVFEKGHLHHFLYRDFGGVRFHESRLKQLGLEVNFHPGSATVVDDLTDLQSKLFYPLFQNHLGELFRALAQNGLSETWAWNCVREVCLESFEKLDGPFIEVDRKALFQPFWYLKKLAWMRLYDKVTEYSFAPLLNPLFIPETSRYLKELSEDHPEIYRCYPAQISKAQKMVAEQLRGAMQREDILPSSCEGMSLKQLLLVGHRAHMGLDWGTLYQELDNAVANLALILAYREANSITSNPWQQIKEAQDSLQMSETLCLEGHNLHPCARTRTDMSVDHLMQASAELLGQPQMLLVSVDRSLMGWSTPQEGLDPNDFASQLFPKVKMDPERVYLPFHKWQCESVIPKVYSQEMERGQIRVESHSIQAKATTSFRTVIIDDTWTVKSSVGSQMTSTKRCMSHQTALNGPLITNLLKEIKAEIGGFEILEEPCGVHFKSEDEAKSRNLTCVYRRSLNSQLDANEVAVSGATLTTVLPDILKDFKGSAQDFFQAYIDLVVPPHLKLFSEYGIALEGHLQNCMVTFVNASPTRLFVRDWGGLRIDLPRLQQAGKTLTLAPGSLTKAKSLESARDKLQYCLFRANLEELVKGIVKHSGLDANLLWKIVRDAVEQNCQRAEDRDFFLAPTWKLKALTRMRLEPDAGYLYVESPNPMSNLEA